VIIFTKVVLPAPLAPIMPTVCSAGNRYIDAVAATAEPNLLCRSCTARIALIVSLPLAAVSAAAAARTASRARPAGTGW